MAIKQAKCLDCENKFYFNDADDEDLTCVHCKSLNVKRTFFSKFSSREKSNVGQATRRHIEETKEMLKEVKKEKWK